MVDAQSNDVYVPPEYRYGATKPLTTRLNKLFDNFWARIEARHAVAQTQQRQSWSTRSKQSGDSQKGTGKPLGTTSMKQPATHRISPSWPKATRGMTSAHQPCRR
ncbi:Hypothetical predicted protein, partial [Pelobates cultripes]